jgi:fructosamine-3-kinase
MIEWSQICSSIAQSTDKTLGQIQARPIGGGCINSCYQLTDGDRNYFVKINTSHKLEMFRGEAQGLRQIAATDTIRVPQPVCAGTTREHAYLVMEYIPLNGPSNSALAGERLAALHIQRGDRFGWSQDNNIGSTLQPNQWSDDWSDFWREQRLAFQLKLAAENGYRGRLQRRGEILLELFAALIDHNPQPALIHGDLWGGNLGYDIQGEPVIYDPAAYYADREAEIAMTELFGGFGNSFYQAYNSVRALDSGYPVRKTLYNLYHVLNHLNLFGGGYLGQAEGMIERLLAELGH